MRRALRRLWYLVRRHRLEADLAEEMAFHRAMAERVASSTTANAADARLEAARRFGSAALALDRSRDVWMAAWVRDLLQDLRFGARLLRKEPAFSAAVVLVLGVGIGVNTTQFTIVDAICIRGLPITRPDRVVYVRARDAHDRPLAMSYRDFDDLRSSSRALAGVAAFTAAPTVIADDTQAPDRVIGVRQSADAFRVLGVHTILGRDLIPRDDVAGAVPVAVIGYGLWSDRYGADRDVIGRSVRVDGTATTIVGVMPAGFGFPSNADVWRPLATVPGLLAQPRDVRTLGVFARMTDSASLAETRTEIAGIATRLARDYTGSNRDIRFETRPINDQFNANIHDPAWEAFVTVGFLILVLASANAANLLLMRAVTRSHEIAVRASLGAGRLRIVRQLLVESAILAVLGGGVGLLIARLGVGLFNGAIPPKTMPFYTAFVIDARVLAMLVAGSAATVLLFGLAPALHLARAGSDAALTSGARVGTGVRAARWMTGFLALEFALAIVLLSMCAASVVFAIQARRAETAVETDGRLTASLTLPPARYPTAERRITFYRELIARLDRAAGVGQAAIASALPLEGGQTKRVGMDGRPDAEQPPIDTVGVTPRYFDAIGVTLRRGRDFDATDGQPGHDAVIVNQPFVDAFLPGADPIGKQVRVVDDAAGTARSCTIVAVSPAVRQRPQGARVDPIVYLPLSAVAPSSVAIIAATAGNAAAIAPLLRLTVANLDADLPLYRVRPLESAMHDANWNPRLSNNLLWILTTIAVALCFVGLCAVTAHGVASRVREIGIRIALGARAPDIVRLVLGRAARQAAYGFLAGIGCTIAWTRLFFVGAARTQGPRPPGPVVFAVIALVLAGLALLASVLPARRALRVDPAVSLKCE